MANGNYTRTPANRTLFKDRGPYEAIVVNNLDTRYMGGLEVELLKYNSAGGTPERSGQLLNVRYLSPFYGVTPSAGLTANDGYQYTQKSYGMWMVPPDIGTKVLVLFSEGDANFGYWIGCIPEDYMNFMIPDGRASTEKTTSITPPDLAGRKLPVGEYNKALETGALVDATLFDKPYNKDFAEILQVQGLISDETRGLTTTSARREIPSAVFGISTPGPLDKRDGAPKTPIGATDLKANTPFSRLGGSSFVMDDGDDKFIRENHPADGPPIYINKEASQPGGDETIPQNELVRFRTRTGHQILMHNSEDLIYIGNARGTTWIEMTSDGKIDIHAQDSVSIMTANDLNITADRDINLEAGRNVNIKASARFSQGAETDAAGQESGRVQIEAGFNHNLVVGKNSKITVANNMHTTVNNSQFITNKQSLHVKSGQDNRLTAGGYTHINSGKEHRETATYIHMNGPNAAVANLAQLAKPLDTIVLPYVVPGNSVPVPYDSILTRAPQHEPWPHHENMDPQAFKKSLTDRENPGGLPTADTIVTPDTFFKNKGGRISSAYVTGSGGSINSGVQTSGGGSATGTGQTPVDNYTSNFEFSDELGSLSAKYESRGDPTIIGYDSTGGWSYGTYQLAAATGAMNEFITYCNQTNPQLGQLLDQAGGAAAARAGTDAFKSSWKTIMNDAGNARVQHDYAVKQYFVPAANKIRNSSGLDVTTKSKTLQDVVWSSSIQHGAGGANNVFKRSLATLGNNAPAEDALIRAVYAERSRDNGMAYFGRSTPNVRSGVVKRFQNELADALKSLQQEVEAAGTPTMSTTDTTTDVPPIGAR
jgi:hypothetical protein